MRTTNPIESTFATVRLRTKVTRGAGSRSAALAMAFKRIESAQLRGRAVNAPRDESCLTGTVQATVSPSGLGPIAEIAWVVGTPWQGRGIATEAARGLVACLDQQPVHTVIAHIHPEHRASAAVATAAGLTPTDEWHEGEIPWHRSIRR